MWQFQFLFKHELKFLKRYYIIQKWCCPKELSVIMEKFYISIVHMVAASLTWLVFEMWPLWQRKWIFKFFILITLTRNLNSSICQGAKIVDSTVLGSLIFMLIQNKWKSLFGQHPKIKLLSDGRLTLCPILSLFSSPFSCVHLIVLFYTK